jgi:WD40 repeat protein
VITLLSGGLVNDASVSDDGRFVVTAGADGKASIWAPDGQLVRTVVHGVGALNRARLSREGNLLVTAGKDGQARIWGRNGEPRGTVKHAASVNDARFSSDAKLLVTASDDGTAVIWRVSDGKRIRTLTGHTEAVVAAAFSPNDALVATGSRDLNARVWNAHSGQPVATLHGHQGAITDVAFSSDGRWLATAGPGSAGIWETRKEGRWPSLWVYFVRRHPATSRINDVAFSARGWRLFVGSPEGFSSYDCRLCGGVKQLTAIARGRLGAIVRTKP